MATLTLKKVPTQLVDELKRQAKENRRSLNQEALLRLERSLAARPRNVEHTIASLRRLHAKMGELPPIDDETIDRAKAAGRP